MFGSVIYGCGVCIFVHSQRWEEDVRCSAHSLESGSFAEPRSRLVACKPQWSACPHPLALGLQKHTCNPASYVGSELGSSRLCGKCSHSQGHLFSPRKQHLNDRSCNSSPTFFSRYNSHEGFLRGPKALMPFIVLLIWKNAFWIPGC